MVFNRFSSFSNILHCFPSNSEVNDTNFDTQAFLLLLIGLSMTQMHTARCESHSVVIDTNAHWTMTQMHTAGFKSDSVHSCHWPMVNDTNARWGLSREGQSSFLREWSMTPMHTSGCKSHSVVNDTNAHLSMTRMHTAGFKSNSVHACHWPMVNDTNAQ